MDRDICDRPPITTPARRVTTFKSTVKETTTVPTSLPISMSSKNPVFSTSKPRTGFATTLPYKKFGNDSTKRLDLEMVLARSKKVNLACTHHIFQTLIDLFTIMVRILSRNIRSIFI